MSDDRPGTIRFCVNNPRSLGEREELIERGYDCKGCLGNCDRCFETRFLEIRGRFVEGADYDQIRRRAGSIGPKKVDGPEEGPPACDSDPD